MSQAATSFAGDLIAKRYVLQDLIGTGRSATVYRALDLQTKTTVALKVLDPLLARDSVTVERFRREVTILRALTHPNVVRVDDAFHEGDVWILCMEYFAALDAKTHLRRVGRMEMGEFLVHAKHTTLARALATARWPLYAAAAVAALAGVTGVVFAESHASTRAATGEALMIALAVCNALMFTALLRVFHHQYRWRGVDWDLYALIALQVVLALVVLLGLTDATMRGPAAPVYGLVMVGWSLFSIDIGLGLLSSFPKALGLWRWYAYLQLGSGVGIASMALLPLAGYLGVAADFVLAVVFFRAARGGG